MPDKSSFFNRFFQRFFFCFGGLFILTLPQRFFLIPETGHFTLPWSTKIVSFLSGGKVDTIYSDSSGFVIWIGFILILSIILALLLTFLARKDFFRFSVWNQIGAAYYLALILLMYGFNKIFLYQFSFPEPNILYTPIGQLNRDILYWSTMGTAPSYSIFAGIMEVIPAILLLFRRTRVLGSLIAFFVLIHVLMTNIGFGIHVKFLSGFLLILSSYIIFPHLKSIFQFFSGRHVRGISILDSPQIKGYFILKPLMIGLILIEALGPAFSVGYFNGNEIPKPYFHGAYQLETNDENIERVFFNKDRYFITSTHHDLFKSYRYELSFAKQHQVIHLYEMSQEIGELRIEESSEHDVNQINFRGFIENDSVSWTGTKIPLDNLPIYQDP
jgi:hypothetical protein